MILVILFWFCISAIFLLTGFAVSCAIEKLSGNEHSSPSVDEYFFTGFLSISAVTGLLSLIIPMNKVVLYGVVILSMIFLLLYHGKLSSVAKNLWEEFRGLPVTWKIASCVFIFVLLSALSYRVTFEDTLTYHAQNIQWIQKYPVVPGLGNLHGRFAFNNMFFVVSAVFTFKIGETVIFPINGLCYLVLSIRLFSLFISDLRSGETWKAVFYILMLLMSLLIMAPNLVTPAPDIICDTLVLYAFMFLFRKLTNSWQPGVHHFLLLSFLVLSCITYKISSVFLAPLLLFFINDKIIKKVGLLVVAGILVLIPYFIRNYFLSGYLVYPFPAVDVFNPDWKIPLQEVSAMKLEIESFAKIVGVAYEEVDAMPFHKWMGPWFAARDFNTKVILLINLLSLPVAFIMLVKKNKIVWIFLVIYLNLLFWLSTAPDPRFAYGFLFTGFALTIAYFIRMIQASQASGKLRYLNFLIILLFIVILARRIKFPQEPFLNPALFVKPAPFETTQTELRKGFNFEYRVALNNENCCYFTEIPCVTYPLDNIMLRGTEMKDGFRPITKNQ